MDFTIPGASCTHSWDYISDSFKHAEPFLREKLMQKAGNGKRIWETHYKNVELISLPPEYGNFRIAFKTYLQRRQIRYFLRPSMACREAIGFKVAQSLGIPVVEVLALGERRNLFWMKRSYFVTRYAEGTQSIGDLKDKPDEREKMLALLLENIAYLGIFHAAGYSHGGAHPRNFLWYTAEDGKCRSVWIDLATSRRMETPGIDWKRILLDLTDYTECYNLSQEELDRLTAEYRKYNDIPVRILVKAVSDRKFSIAVQE